MEKCGIGSKKLMLEELKEKLQGSADLFVTSFSAIPVAEQDQLRRKLKEDDASLLVVKNRIASQVFKQLEKENLTSLLQGPIALTFGGSSSLTVSKALVDFAGKHESFKILGAYVDGKVIETHTVKRLASIPSKEALIAQIIGGLNSPIQGLVNTLSATIKKFVMVLEKIKEKNELKGATK